MLTAKSLLENAYQFSRFDLDHPMSTCSSHPILLDEKNWLTCEHYIQANSMVSDSHANKIGLLPSGEQAYRFGKAWYRKKRADYNIAVPILMKRALYTKVQMYDDVKAALLSTGDKLIIETSQYDYFGGIGRDQRGHNHLGKAWMDIREKLMQP